MNIHSQSEILVNKAWRQAFGAPEDYEWAKSVLDNAGNLVTTGHMTIDQNNTKLVLVKQNPDGDILWQKDFQLSENTKNGGVTLAIDENDNIIVGGVTSASGNTSDFDFLILKYGSGGQIIWDQTFEGPGNGIDVPTAIVIEEDQVFICGPSEGDKATGRQVMSAEGIETVNQNQPISLDVSHLPSGIYTCVFRGGAYTLSANFVKL